ncbi:hypothetical protein [Mailhella sp.]|uniref:hypothetical protein n=1 Tax=Mailhella sp. TaxID=1981029 RepID=UPI003AB87B11
MQGVFSFALRAGVDKILKSGAVMDALRRRTKRYAQIVDLGCAPEGGIEVVVRLLGFSEEVRVVLSRAEVEENGAWIRPTALSADREGVDALLKDFVQGKRFTLPEAAKPFAGPLRKFFSS